MNAEELKRSYTAAALPAAVITGSVVFYAVLVELLLNKGFKAILQPPPADMVKYGFYAFAASVLPLLKVAGLKLGAKKATREETVKALTTLAIVRAALCEIPVLAGFIICLLTGSRPDFYLLAVFAVGLEIYNFPRLSQWEERIRSDFGQI